MSTKSKIAPIIFLLFLASCGTKKKFSGREASKVSTLENREISFQQTRFENARILTDSVGTRTTYEPIDPERPSRVGETTFENTRIVIEDVKKKRQEESRDSTITQAQDKRQIETNSTTGSRTTDSDVERQSPWPWLAGAFFVILLLVWLRFKGSPPPRA